MLYFITLSACHRRGKGFGGRRDGFALICVVHHYLVRDLDKGATHVLLETKSSKTRIPEGFSAFRLIQNGSRNERCNELQVAEKCLGSNVRVTEKVLENFDYRVRARWIRGAQRSFGVSMNRRSCIRQIDGM